MFRPVNRRNGGSPDIRNNMNICLREIFQQPGGCRPASEKTKFRCTVSQKEIRCPDSFCVFRYGQRNVIAFDHMDLKACFLGDCYIVLKRL